MEGQLSILDIFPDAIPKRRTMKDFYAAERQGKEFLFSEWEMVEIQEKMGKQCSFWFYTEGAKCCNTFPLLRQTQSLHKPLSYCQCLVCGKKTKPIDDYSWMDTKHAWNKLNGFVEDPEKVHPGRCSVFNYLRYGPHTLVESVADSVRDYLSRFGVPKDIKFDKSKFPCENCTWYDGKVCCSGGHSCHFEYDICICDGFKRSITERKPSTVGVI